MKVTDQETVKLQHGGGGRWRGCGLTGLAWSGYKVKAAIVSRERSQFFYLQLVVVRSRSRASPPPTQLRFVVGPGVCSWIKESEYYDEVDLLNLIESCQRCIIFN